MAGVGVVAAGQMADDAIFELQVHLGIRPANAPRCMVEKGVHSFYIAAEKAHDVERVGVQGANVKPRRGLVGIANPHRHVDQQQMAELAFIDPLFGLGRRWHKAVVEVDAIIDTLFLRLFDHGASLNNIIRDRLFAQHVEPSFQTLHGRLIMIAAILYPSATNADRVQLLVFEQFFHAVIGAHAVTLRRFVGALLVNITNGHQIGQGVGLINGGMGVANVAQADHGYF